MSKRIQSIRGMHDVLPPESGVLRAIEHATQNVLQQYGLSRNTYASAGADRAI